jgi:hypothetical protein
MEGKYRWLKWNGTMCVNNGHLLIHAVHLAVFKEVVMQFI